MNPLPTPPTDNLYKFVAMVGVLLVVVGLATPYLVMQDYHDHYSERIDRLNATGRELEQKIDSVKSTDAVQYSIEVSRIAGLIKAESESLHRWNEQRWKLVQAQQAGLEWCWSIGAVLAGLGIFTWFVRLQQYQDRQMKAETLKKERDAQAPAVNAQASFPSLAEATVSRSAQGNK